MKDYDKLLVYYKLGFHPKYFSCVEEGGATHLASRSGNSCTASRAALVAVLYKL
jgi:hypothetical protein